MMYDRLLSYQEFLKHKDNIELFLAELFKKTPDVYLYFPENLNSDERKLIYSKSKGYLFEKLKNTGSNYSIKLWKPRDKNVDIAENLNDDESYEETESLYTSSILCENYKSIENNLISIHDELLELKNDLKTINSKFKLVTCLNLTTSVLLLAHVTFRYGLFLNMRINP